MLAAVGVLFAAVSGLPALLLGDAYLTHLWATLPLIVTDLKVSTVLIFDLGVYLCVWGSLAGYALALLAVDEPVAGQLVEDAVERLPWSTFVV